MILIADGNETRRDLLADLIGNQLGQIVVEVSEAQELNRWLLDQMPRLVIFEANLLGNQEQLFAFITQLRSRTSILQLPIMAILEPHHRQFSARILDLGCNDCLNLPLDLDHTRARIRNQLRFKEDWELAKRLKGISTSETFEGIIPPNQPLDYTAGHDHFHRPRKQQTLLEWLNTDAPSEKQRLLLLQDLARTIHQGHLHGYLFIDLNPQQITVQPNGEVLVNGHGPHSPFEQNPNRENPTIRPLTPEQFAHREADLRTDVFLFGLIAFYTLSGLNPYSKLESQGAPGRIQLGEIEPIARLAPNLHQEIQGWIQNCCETDPDERYQNMVAVFTALQGLSQFLQETTDEIEEFSAPVAAVQTRSQVTQLLEADPTQIDQLFNEIVGQIEEALRGGTLPYAVREIISETETTVRLLETFLNPEHWHQLYALFKLLAHDSAVPGLIRSFAHENREWYLVRLAQLLVLCAQSSLQPLVTFGLSLEDQKAAILLSAFYEYGGRDLSIYLELWSKHQGLQTQMELIKQLALLNLADPVCKRVMQDLGQRSIHPTIRRMALDLSD